MVVRAYEEADHAAIEKLAPRLQIGVAPWIDAQAALEAVRGWVEASLATNTVFVADENGAVVGFVSVKERTHWSGAREAYVGELVVAEEAEGKGVGRALMAAAEQWARDRGLARMSLETGAANAGARAFYAALGYEESDVSLSRALS
jgi:GNAT superfamily N-acetyltransferase